MPGALAAVVVSPSIAWVLADRRVWPWDQAWYGEVSTDLFYLLTHAPNAWLSAMIRLMPSKPPLLCWLGQFFVALAAVTGNVEASLLGFIVAIQFATLVLVWVAARALAPDNRWAAAAAVLLAGSAPLFIGMTHQYFVEPLQACVVAASLLLAIIAPRLRPMRSAGLLALLVVIGFGAKTTTFLYCGASWLVTVAALARQPALRKPGPSMARADAAGWLAMGLAFGLWALTAFWYLANVVQIEAHMRASVTDTLYGSAGPFSDKLWYWIGAADAAFFDVPFLWIALVLIAGLAVGRALRRSLSGDKERALVAACALIQIVAPVALLASQPNEETRFLLPALPNLAVLAAWLLRERSWRIPAIAASALFAAQWSLGHLQAHGLVRGYAESPWLLAVDTDQSNRSVAREIVHETCPAADANSMNIIAPEYPQMNANSVAFFAAKERLQVGHRCFYTSLGYAEDKVERALARIAALNALFVVVPQRKAIPENPDAFNRVLRPVQAVLSASSEFSRAGTAGGYEIFRRR